MRVFQKNHALNAVDRQKNHGVDTLLAAFVIHGRMMKTELEELAYRIRRTILDVAVGRTTHLGGSLSIVEILAVLYGSVLNLKQDGYTWEDRDRFILSKGHAALALYSAIYESGYGLLSKDDLMSFEKTGGLPGHPVIDRQKGIEFTTGSLGMGLSLGMGAALAAKKKGKNYRVYVLMGDGECNEGSVWEAMKSAWELELGNLTIIIDRNFYQLDGSADDALNAKLNAFDIPVLACYGHDIKDLIAVFNTTINNPYLPVCIYADTIKGKGVSFMEDNNDWHHAFLSKEQYELAIKELE